MEDTIGERLDRMEELICSIAERLTEVARPLPTILKRADAARELGVSLSVLKGMIRRGEVLESQKRGETRGIPWSEILRLATPTQPKGRKATAKKPAPIGSARDDAAEYLRRIRDR